MKVHRVGSRVWRAKWAILFALVLFAASAIAPVLAQSDTEPSPIPAESPITPDPQGDGSVSLPGPEDLMKAHEAAEREGRERAEALASPAAVQQRESSRHAYSGMNAVEAEALLRSVFPGTLAQLNSEPGRYLSDAHLDRPLGEGDAIVTSEGDTALMEGTISVEAKDDEGELEKVDLSLEKTPEGFEEANPLVEVTIGATAEDGIEVGNGGLTITQSGAEASSVGQPFGDKNVFFGEVEAGSDGEGALVDPSLRSHSVLNGETLEAQPIQVVQEPKVRRYVCWSGVISGNHCGMVTYKHRLFAGDGHERIVYRAVGPAAEGDSGGPVWDPVTHKAVGLITSIAVSGACHTLPIGSLWCPRMDFTPLLPHGSQAQIPGILPFLGVEVLKEG